MALRFRALAANAFLELAPDIRETILPNGDADWHISEEAGERRVVALELGNDSLAFWGPGGPAFGEADVPWAGVRYVCGADGMFEHLQKSFVLYAFCKRGGSWLCGLSSGCNDGKTRYEAWGDVEERMTAQVRLDIHLESATSAAGFGESRRSRQRQLMPASLCFRPLLRSRGGL